MFLLLIYTDIIFQRRCLPDFQAPRRVRGVAVNLWERRGILHPQFEAERHQGTVREVRTSAQAGHATGEAVLSIAIFENVVPSI